MTWAGQSTTSLPVASARSAWPGRMATGNGSFLACCRCSTHRVEDAKATVATAAQMGVKIKMVTGDALAIARETAKTLGMGGNILDGATLADSRSEETAAMTIHRGCRRFRTGIP